MERWQQKVIDWQQSPRLFASEALGIECQQWQIDDVLTPIENGKKRIAIRAGHGVGKTTIEAIVILWFLLFRRPCKIPVTANSQDQLRDVLWAEVSKWHRRLPDFLRLMVEINAEKIFIKADPEGAFAVARTARPERPEALQGFHSENLLFVLEEASGIEDIIFETAGGALTGEHSMVLMCANPTRASGYFYRAFHQNRAEWHCVHVPCHRSPLVDPAYATRMANEYGEDSNVYRVRVLGEFPKSEDNAVIPLELIEAAIDRKVAATAATITWGLDVARFGDDTTALAKRRGNTLLDKVQEWKKLDTMQVVGLVAREYDRCRLEDAPTSINVDVIGIGAGVVDRLRERGYPARGINVGESASTDPQRFMRLRDELWWKGREWFERRDCSIPADEALIAELVSPLYKIESNGKIKVESKDDMKKRGVKSPNKADAFLLSLATNDRLATSRPQFAMSDYDPFNLPAIQSSGSRQSVATWDPFA